MYASVKVGNYLPRVWKPRRLRELCSRQWGNYVAGQITTGMKDLLEFVSKLRGNRKT